MNRMKEKITMKEQAWAFILDYFWAPVVTAIVALWAAIHKVDKKVVKQTSDLNSACEDISAFGDSCEKIYDKIDNVRKDLTEQHSTLRKEQREDFKEIRELIGSMNPK